MAYQNYLPMNYGAYQMPAIQTPPQLSQTSSNASSNSNSGIIWVQGENGAKAYLTAPNTSVLLMDSEANKFYIKSSDPSGMPLPLRKFKYEEEFDDKQGSIKPEIDTKQFVTHDELEKRLSEIKKEAKDAE